MSGREELRLTCGGKDLAAARNAVAGFIAADPGTAAAQFAANQSMRMADRLALPQSRIAVLSSFTLDPLEPFLAVREFLAGRRLQFFSVPYEQWYSALRTPGKLDEFDPDLVLLLQHLEDVAPALALRHLAATAELGSEGERLVAAIDESLGAFRRRSSAPVALSTYVAAERGVERYFDRRATPSRMGTIDALNARLSPLADAHQNIFVYDYAQTVADFGRLNWFDPVKNHHVKTAIAARALPCFAADLSAFITTLTRPRKKVLVTDLDNTLWGGVVGEDGPDGIVVSGDYPGNAYADFQAFLANLRATGIVLAVASKNNQADVEEVFRLNPKMPLKWEDFTAHRIDWNDKAANLRSIAEEINVGVDSLVFVDDNPMECDLVRTYLPEVTVVQLKDSPSLYPRQILDSGCLYASTLSEEDRGRAKSYAAERARTHLAATTDTGSFLASLGMTLTLREPRDGEIERVTQLIGKTNQFNLTAKRYTQAEILSMREDKSISLKIARLSDTYGEYGLIGVIITVDRPDAVREIDNFLVSCRALGRNVEQAVLADIESEARDDGIRRLVGRYLPTAKNSVAADFYPGLGFVESGEAGTFEHDLTALPPLDRADHITITRE